MKVSFLLLLLVLLLPSFLEAGFSQRLFSIACFDALLVALDEEVHSTRQLASLDRSWFTGENVRTFNGA